MLEARRRCGWQWIAGRPAPHGEVVQEPFRGLVGGQQRLDLTPQRLVTLRVDLQKGDPLVRWTFPRTLEECAKP